MGLEPEYVGIVVGVAKDEFGGGLRFPDASQSIERLRLGQRGRSRDRETFKQRFQQVFAPGEEWIGRIGNVPELFASAGRGEQTKLGRGFAVDLAQALAKIGSGSILAVFPATDIDGRCL